MNVDRDASCPCCEAEDLCKLGELPNNNWFAGRRLDDDIPGGRLYHCLNCDLRFRYPARELSEYNQLYDNSQASTWSDVTLRPDWDLIGEAIQACGLRDGSVLDFGCYSGGLLERLESSFDRYGVEINSVARQIASEKCNAEVWSTLAEIPESLKFDIVVAADVLEHLRNPAELIDNLLEVLGPNGLLIFTTGDANNYFWKRFGAAWWYCYYPEHIAFLSKTWFDNYSSSRKISVRHFANFRYRDLSIGQRISHAILMCCYGFFPMRYLAVVNYIRKLRGRHTMTNVPGNGVCADHFLIVLAREGTK